MWVWAWQKCLTVVVLFFVALANFLPRFLSWTLLEMFGKVPIKAFNLEVLLIYLSCNWWIYTNLIQYCGINSKLMYSPWLRAITAVQEEVDGSGIRSEDKWSTLFHVLWNGSFLLLPVVVSDSTCGAASLKTERDGLSLQWCDCSLSRLLSHMNPRDFRIHVTQF